MRPSLATSALLALAASTLVAAESGLRAFPAADLDFYEDGDFHRRLHCDVQSEQDCVKACKVDNGCEGATSPCTKSCRVTCCNASGESKKDPEVIVPPGIPAPRPTMFIPAPTPQQICGVDVRAECEVNINGARFDCGNIPDGLESAQDCIADREYCFFLTNQGNECQTYENIQISYEGILSTVTPATPRVCPGEAPTRACTTITSDICQCTAPYVVNFVVEAENDSGKLCTDMGSYSADCTEVVEVEEEPAPRNCAVGWGVDATCSIEGEDCTNSAFQAADGCVVDMEYCYEVSANGDQCIDLLSAELTIGGTTGSFTNAFADQVCGGAPQQACETISINTCQCERPPATTVTVVEDTDAQEICDVEDSFAPIYDCPDCDLSVEVTCRDNRRPDATNKMACENMLMLTCQEEHEVEYCYNIRNTGTTCVNQVMVNGDLKTLSTDLCPNQSVFACEPSTINSCLDNCYTRTYEVLGENPATDICRSSDSHTFCTKFAESKSEDGENAIVPTPVPPAPAPPPLKTAPSPKTGPSPKTSRSSGSGPKSEPTEPTGGSRSDSAPKSSGSGKTSGSSQSQSASEDTPQSAVSSSSSGSSGSKSKAGKGKGGYQPDSKGSGSKSGKGHSGSSGSGKGKGSSGTSGSSGSGKGKGYYDSPSKGGKGKGHSGSSGSGKGKGYSSSSGTGGSSSSGTSGSGSSRSGSKGKGKGGSSSSGSGSKGKGKGGSSYSGSGSKGKGKGASGSSGSKASGKGKGASGSSGSNNTGASGSSF